MAHQAGYVNILGKPNAGKSTLLNLLVGERLAIITPKAQTTRKRMLGIVNDTNFQIIYSDTPGIIKPHYKLHEAMMGFIHDAIKDADVFILITDIVDRFDDVEILTKLSKIEKPIIVLINKIDVASQEQIADEITFWQTALTNTDIIAISALHKFNTAMIQDRILKYLPESPPYFDKDELTDKPERFIVAEIVREKIFVNYQKEIPYCTEVVVEAFKEEPTIIRINAIIYVARDSQKNIVIGHGGKALKRVGIQARKSIEDFFQKQVYLELFVKVSKDWRDNPIQLRNFGYTEQ